MKSLPVALLGLFLPFGRLCAGPMPTATALEAAVYATEETGAEIHLARPKKAKWSLVHPSDLGPEDIDVRSYPKEHQHTYQYIIKERCLRCHTAARIWNSPLVEMEEDEIARERRKRPWLFASGNLVKAEPQIWRRYVKKMRQLPACCGGCSDMGPWEIKAMSDFLDYDSRKRKTGAASEAWAVHRRGLIKAFVARRPANLATFAADLEHANFKQHP